MTTATVRITLDDLCEILDLDPDALSEETVGALIDRDVIDPELTLVLCDGPSRDERSYDPDTDDADAIADDWVRGGSWPEGGARIDVSWWVTDRAGRETDRGRRVVTIEPDHAVLIREAMGSAESCGDDPEDHDWTHRGEGGCDENPGVQSHGGTAMSFDSHCRRCGLHRHEYHAGSQRNPGEIDTVEYRLLDDEEIEWHRDNGSMDDPRRECASCGKRCLVAEDETDPGADEVALDARGLVAENEYVCGACLSDAEDDDDE